MSQTFELRELTVQPVLSIRQRVKPEEMQQAFAEFFGEVWKHIEESGKQPSGMPFTRYHSMDDSSFDLECGLPVATTMGGAGRIQSSELPGGSVAFSSYVGPYERLSEAHDALVVWMGENGHQVAGAPWEFYVTDPGEEPDPSKWETDIYYPVL
jgi:effector-binding domain-containing protein